MKLLSALVMVVKMTLAVADMRYVSLPESTSPGGKCMDGTQAGYYIREGTDPNLFVIYLKGGGACGDFETCKNRARGNLGSSKNYPDSMKDSEGGILLHSDCRINPDFCKATAVYVPYCTSDTHMGTAEASDETWNFYFDGHSNFKAIVDKLILESGLKDSSDSNVFLSGGSAGAIGAYFNVDGLQTKIPKATVKAAPMAGWYSPGALEGDLPSIYSPSNYTNFKAGTHGNSLYDLIQGGGTPYDLWQMTDVLPTDCINEYSDQWWVCVSMHQAYRYIKAPLFHVHTQFDSHQLFNQLGAPQNPVDPSEQDTVKEFIKKYGEASRVSLQKILDNEINTDKAHPDGVFSASCLTHGTGSSTTIADDLSWYEIVGDWFFQGGKLTDYYRQVEECPDQEGWPLPCNSFSGCGSQSGSPLVEKCKEGLGKAGCLKSSNEELCLQCAKRNGKDILNSGCNPKDEAIPVIKDICKSNDGLSPTIMPSTSPSNSTPDDPEAKYVKKINKKGKKKQKTCGKLMEKKDKKIKKDCCHNKYGEEGAAVVCPLTCSICA